MNEDTGVYSCWPWKDDVRGNDKTLSTFPAPRRRILDQEIPHHSTFSKNRCGQFRGLKLFEEIVCQSMDVGFLQGEHLSVDGSLVEPTPHPCEQLEGAAPVVPHS